MTYTLEIISLECLKNQELDGDEIVIKFNDKVMFHWEDTGYRWAVDLQLEDWTNFYNFRTNKMRTMNGDVDVPAYADFGFAISGLSGKSVVVVWESDEGNIFRGEDDKLGQLEVDENSIADTAQVHEFTWEKAHYRMVYAVTLDA